MNRYKVYKLTEEYKELKLFSIILLKFIFLYTYFLFCITCLICYYFCIEDIALYLIKYPIFFTYFNINMYRFFLIIILMFSLPYFLYVTPNYLNKIDMRIIKFNYIIIFFTLFFLIHANNLMLILILIEIINMCIYVIIKNQKNSFVFAEAALKLFINNSIFTLLFLFGSAII